MMDAFNTARTLSKSTALVWVLTEGKHEKVDDIIKGSHLHVLGLGLAHVLFVTA